MGQLNEVEVADKWARNMTGAVASIKAGVLAVHESPMDKAAAAADRYAAGVQAAVADGRYQEGLRSVSLDEWKRLTAEKGTTRIAGGVAEAKPKMQQFLAQLLPYTRQVSKEIQAMPKGDLSSSAARMMANMEKMAQFRFRRRR